MAARATKTRDTFPRDGNVPYFNLDAGLRAGDLGKENTNGRRTYLSGQGMGGEKAGARIRSRGGGSNELKRRLSRLSLLGAS